MKDGFISINKTAGMTSHDVVNRVRRIFNTKKVGHAGTLDPFATGVLPVAVGKATKFMEYLADCDKSYRAEILFGIETATGDITGEVINQSKCKPETLLAVDLSLDGSSFNSNSKPGEPRAVDEILQSFIGTIQQTPPKYSAIKVNGRKAYELARKNVEFELPSRKVTMYNLIAISNTDSTLTIDVDCSKGTYIRSLAVDIGRKLGLPATLKTLQRTKVGKFSIQNSVTLEELENLTDKVIIDIDSCLEHLPKFDLPQWRLKAFCNGLTTRITETLEEGALFRVYVGNDFIGTGKIIDGELKAAKICR